MLEHRRDHQPEQKGQIIIMKLGILGTGIVGTNLGHALTKAGHTVMFSSRTPDSEKMQALISDVGGDTQAGTVAETVTFGEIIIVAIGWPNDLEAVLKSVSSWDGKVIVDTTNRFVPAPAWSKGSCGEDIAHLTGAPVLKAFNSIGAQHYLDPTFAGCAVSGFICGDDEAKEKAQSLVTDIGFELVDVGGLDQCHGLEMLAAVWVNLAYTRGMGHDIALTLVHK